METEIDIPVSVSSKKGDREDDALSSEFLEGKVTEQPGNKVKQLESGTNQSLETSSHVVETVNTQLETDKTTAEGGNFFQALSVPMVTADEHSNTPESCEATTTEDQEERKKSKIEAFTEGKPNDDERVEVIASKEASANELQPKTEDHDIVEAISAQNEGSIVHALGLVKGSDKDIEGVTEFCNKDERMSGSSEAKAEAGKEEHLQGKNYSEGKEPESVKTKENIEEDTEEIRPSVETEEKTEYEGLRDGIATDVCVSTQTKPEEGTTEDEEKKDEKAIESDNGQMKKLGRPLVKEACEETGLEKGESEEGLELSDSMAPSKKELASNDEDQEKEQVLNIFGKDQDDGDDFTGSQYATCDDIKETTGQHATTVDYFKEQDLNETPGEILKEETEDKSVDAKEGSEQPENGARDEREQKPMESINEIVNSCSEIEQEEQIEEIRPSVEIEEEMEQKGLLHAITTDTCISTQTKSQVEAPEHEEKDEEEATESDDGQKEKSDNPSMKKVCEETAPKKVESEKEKAISVLHKDEDQEKEQEVNMSEKDQGEDNITSSQNATFEGGLQKKNQHSESNEPELVIEEDTEEIRSGVKTLEKTEQQRLIHAISTAVCISTQTEPEGTTENKEKNDEEAIGSDDGQTKKPGSPTVKKVCEEVVPEKAESEEVLKHSDNSSMALNENEIASKDEDQEKEQELYVSGKGQGGGVDVTSSQNASSEDIQETTTGQHATTLAYFEEGQDLYAMPKYILKEEAEDKTINPQEASEQCENEAKDKKEQKPEESVNKIVHSCSEIEQEEDTEEIKPSVETKEKSEQQELLHAITTDACISTQTNSHVESAEHEENKEETIESDDGQKEKSDNLSVREICEEMGSEKVESEGVKLSDNFSMKQNEKTIGRLNKDEDQEIEHELSMSEKDQGEDDVTYSQDSASVEDLQEKNYNDEGRGPKFVTTRESIEEVTEETISSMERKENVEQQGLLHAITTDACLSTQTESQVGTKEHEEKNGEEVIESAEGQKENSESSLVKDVCEYTASEKVEYDEVKHSNSSTMKLDEKAITSKDEDQESEQKVNMSEKDQVEDDITSLHDTTFEGGLQEKKHHSEGNEPEVVKTKESLAEGTEEIIYSVESKEKTEEQRLMHAITTDVCLSAQTEPEEETTEENEEKIEEDAIESDDGQTNKPGSPVVKEVCDETVSEKADESEEGLKHSDSSSMKLNENELASKDEYREKEQELDMLEKGQDGGDDVTSSQNASNEDIKEMIDQHATKVAYFDEVQGLNALPKDILKEEAKDRTTDPQEASEEYENGANDKRGQKAEEIIHSCSEIEQEEYAEEIKPSAEIEGKKEEQGLMHAIITDAWISTQTKSQEESQLETTENEEKKEEVTESDDGRKEKFNNPSIKEVREETDAEKVESEGVELYHNSGMKLNEKAIAILRKDEDLEKEQELNMSEQDQHKDGVTCSQGATSVKDLQGKEPEFVKTRESMEEDIEGNKSSVERKEKVEQQVLLLAITTDVCISTQTGSQEENTKNAEEAIESADGRKEKSDNDSGKEVCEEAGIEKDEFEEGMKHSDSSNMKLNEKAIAILSKDEDQKKEQAFNMPEEYQGEDEVTCSWDTSSKEDLEGKNYDGEHNEPKLDETRESIKEDIEVIRTNVETEERKEQQGSLHAITTDVCMSARTEPQEETTKAEEENEAIERYDGQKEKPAIPSVKEVCEETSLENAESKEGVKLFDSSRRKLNEKAIATFKDEDQEKDQEVNMSAKGSQDAASKEDLQEKNYHKDDNESEFVKTRQSIEEDIEKIKSNVETKGNSEHQGLLHVITTDVCSSTQTEPEEEAAENEEKNDEEAIHDDDGRTKKSENPLVKEVCEATGLQKAEFEGVKHFDSSRTTLNENDLSSKDKDQEKEQELKMSEVQCGGDDVISSQNTQSEDIKETTIQHATTIADFKEQGLNERPKGILKEETEDKSVDAQEASEQCENGAKDRREQETEDSVNKPVHSHSEIIGEHIKEDDADAGNNKEEISFEKLKYEAGEAGDGTECETAGVTQKISPENKDDATADESKSTEEILHDVEMSYDKAGSPLAEEIEDEKFNKKEDWNMDSETHMQKGDVTKKVDEEHFYATYEQKSIDASEQEKSIPGELQARVEKELQEDTRSHQLKDYGSENPCTTTQDILEEVGEKTTMKPEKITKQDFQESQSETDKEIEAKLDAENQADRTEDRSEMKDDVVLTEKMSLELGQPMEHNVEEIQACRTKTMSEKTEDEIQKKEKDVPHGSIEDTNDDITKEEKCFLDGRTREIEISTLEHETVEEHNGGLDEASKEKYTDPNETTSVEPQEDSMPSSSLGISTDGSSNSEKSKAESENLPIEDLESVSEVQIPGVVPNSEDSNLKEECLISETATYVNEETGTVTKEISSDEISYSDPIPVGNPEVTKVRVDAQTGQEDLQAAEDISCESRASSTIQALKMDMKEGPEKSVGISGEVKNASVDEAPKQERLPALEDAATLEPQVNLPYLESTYPSESEKSPMQALESVYEVQTPEVVAYSKDSKVKEECIDLATAKYTDENNVEEEQKIKINELSSAEKKEQAMESKQVAEHPSISYLGAVLIEEELGRSSEHENTTDEGRSVTDPYQDSVADKTIGESCPPATEVENVKQAPTKSDEAKRSDPNTEEKALTKENLELHGEVKPTSELMIEEYQVNEAKPQPEQSDITSENISKCQTLESKLEHRSEKDLVDGRRDMEHDVTLAPEFHIYSTEDQNETMKNLILTDKLLDEIKENDAKEDIEVIVRQEEKAIEDSYQDAVAEVTVHERLSQTEEVKARIEKLVSMVPPEELTSPRAKDQTYELVPETDKTKVEHSCISKEDRIPELTEEKVTNKISEDQRSIKERYIEEEGQDNFGVENKEARSVNVVVDDVIENEVLLEVEKSKESKSLNDNINEEDSCVHNQLTSATDELCQIKKLNSSPNELLEAKGSVEDTEDPKLMAGNLNLKAENFTVMKGPYEDKKQNVEKTSEIVASEFERLENMVTEEKKIEADANKERETLEEPQADDPAKTISESTTSSTEQDKEVRSEESSGQGDVHKLEEKPTEVFEITSEVVEIVAEGREASAILTENVQEASSKMFLVKHDPEITTTIEKIEDEIKDKDETLVNVHLFTSTKEVACLSNEKTEEIQVSTLNSEIDEGKQNGLGDMLNKEREAVQPQEHISNIKFVDPPSDVEIREQRELMHCGLQEPSEDNALLSHNDKKIADSLILPSVEKEIIQGVDKRFEEAPAIDFQKHEKGLDNTTKARIVDVVSNAECSEIEQQHLDTKEATLESINQEYQSEQKKEVDESIESEIPIQKVSEQTIAHKEIANEFLVMSVAKEEEKKNNLQDRSKEQEYSGESMHQDLEAVKKPFQTKKLSDKVNKAGPIDIQEETMAEGNLHKEETEERTNITAATVNLHHREKSDETKCKGTSTEAAIPVEYVKISDVELECDMDAPVPKCASIRNPEVRSADLEGPSVMDATADKAGYNKDPSDKTTEVHVAEKGVLKEDVHLESTCDKSKTTEKVSGMNQEPFNLPLTTERSMELDAPVMHGTAATEDVQISQKCVTDDLIKISQIQPEKEKYKISACTEDKQLPNKPHQNESMESKLLPGNINASHEEGEPTAKSLNAEAEDLKATNASGTKPQCSSEVVKEGKKISDEKEKSETPEPAKILFTDILHESTQGNSEVAENLIEERKPALTKDQQVDKETGDSGAKTDGENEEEEDDEDKQKMGSCSDALVMVEASKDMEVKVHKKSHNILSGVGSKVKHSIAKVKKAITGKSSHPKPPSPKGRD